MALGAERTSVLRHVVSGGMTLAGTGLLVGIAASVGLSRFASALLFEVRPTDIATYAGVSSVLIVVAFLACYLPARRASAVDPMVALRE
jgi:putative ABC transport system permease protein